MKKKVSRNRKKFIARSKRTSGSGQTAPHGAFSPIPAVFDVAWATDTNIVYLASTQTKLIELFMNHFTLTFDLHLEPMTPYALAASMLDEKTLARLDDLEPTSFV
ncbi:MAG: hypothetical protein ACLT2T_13195 [Bilophila wadsworthia]